MSGIYGRLNIGDTSVDEASLEPIRSELRVWGPDAFDEVKHPNAILMQSTLKIAPYSEYDEIIQTESGFVVCSDAIIDNRAELALDLGLNQFKLENLSDTALIAMAWDLWGPECVQHLVGDFAFSVTNPKTKYVFVARDHIGARPLYWSKRSGTMIWSTSAKVLIDHREWGWPVDQAAVVAFQANTDLPLPTTFFLDLKRVEPGCQVEFNQDDIILSRWWNPIVQANTILGSPEAYTQRCRGLVERAINDRINSRLPIGTHLSGGIDSTGVSVLAARLLKEQKRKLSGGYTWSPPFSEYYPDFGPNDERRRIVSVAQKEGIPIRFGTANGESIFEFLECPLETEGIADLAAELPALKEASRDNVRVMLSGWGGDEGFSAVGHGYVGYLVQRLMLAKAANFIRSQTRSLWRLSAVIKIIWWQGVHPMLSGLLYQLFDQFDDKDDNLNFMPKNVKLRYRKLIAQRRKIPKFFANPARNIKAFIDCGHIGMRMETWATRSAPYHVQYRYPLTDRRLLEFLMSIPPEAMFPNELSRGLSRQVLEDVIPPDVQKFDAANEALRQKSREECWRITAERVGEGLLSQECPWLEMPQLREAALNPVDQSTSYGVARFGELVSAMRLWFMWVRNKHRPGRPEV